MKRPEGDARVKVPATGTGKGELGVPN